jgi:hypothetical protein
MRAILSIAFAASCVHALPGSARFVFEPRRDDATVIEPKAPTAVNKALVAARAAFRVAGKRPGARTTRRASARFAALDSRCRNGLGPWCAGRM